MRTLSACLALALLACGSPSGPEPETTEPTGPPSLAIVSGDNQEVAVTDTLPFDAVVRVMRDGKPVADQLVDWRVLEDNAGEPFVTTTRTDSTGTVKNRVIAGTRAFTHPDMDGSAHMEVRWVEQSSGDAIVDTTLTYRVLPGEIESLDVLVRSVPSLDIGEPLVVPDLAARLGIDEFSNPIIDPAKIDVQWWFEHDFEVGPQGTGWDAGPVPELHRHGWFGAGNVDVDTTDAEIEWPADSLEARGTLNFWAEALGPDNTSTATSSIFLDVWLPACWEASKIGTTRWRFEPTRWSADCPSPQEQIK